MPTPKKFAVGDKVMVTSVNGRTREPVERTVVKVGRTNVTLDGSYFGVWQEKTYNMETGGETGNYSHEHVWTLQDWADREKRSDLVERLKASALLEPYRYGFDRIPISKLERIVAIMEEAE